AAALGGTVLGDAPELIDGSADDRTSATFTADELKAGLPVIDLAGDAPVSLAGVLLTPAGVPSVGDRLRDFAISTSLDGERFERVLTGRLSARPAEQAFVFAAPVEARFLRLEPIDNHRDDRNGYGAAIGEVKAVAVPGTVPP